MSTRQLWRVAAVLLGLIASPALASAQQSGTITGRVVDRATQQPLPDAQVLIAGTQRGTRTNERGEYRIVGVPAGDIQIRAVRIGYVASSRTVNVPAGATVSADLALAVSATTLDEITVTATGETQRRRESGVTTARIDTAQVNMANVQNFSDVLSSRAPGVAVQAGSGTTGTSSRIRIRGSNSINLNNNPLLIVDGTRVNNSSESSSIGVGGQTMSRFNDINPEEIENIEVIKGPAAASLFGTAAANGVIQVTTKRGRAGRARWSALAEYGNLDETGDWPRNFGTIGRTPAGARITTCNIDFQARGVCTPFADSLVSTSPIDNLTPFRNGWREAFGTNVSGGSEVAQYYLGGDFEREEGVYPINFLRKTNLRANINAQLRQNVTAAVNAGYVSSRLGLPQNDNNTFGAISGALLGKAFDCGPAPRDPSCGGDTAGRGYLVANNPGPRFFAVQNEQDVEHLIGSGNATWQPLSWLNLIGTAGLDLIEREDRETLEAGGISVFFPEGYRVFNNAQIRTYTANASAVANFLIRPDLRSVTTLGTQWNREYFQRVDASGEVLLPGTGSLGGLSSLFSIDEVNTDIVTLGYLANQRLEWRDRVFLSLGLRADKNSNFGVNLPFVKYPSVGLSWVVADEPFFPQNMFFSALRLRAAYGESGQRPEFRQANPFFNPVTATVQGLDAAAVTIGGTGNAELKPERTKEFEFGFDAGLLNDRVGLELTWYNKQTRDALIGRRLAPSIGATLTQLINLGRVDNEGYEYLVNLKALERERFKFDLTVSGSVNDNEVVDLGEGITPIIFGLGANTQRHQNGYPLAGYWGHQIVSFQDRNGDGMISRINCPTTPGLSANPQIVGGPACELVLTDSQVYSGNPLGRSEMSITPQVTLFDFLQIRALFNHRGGLTLNNSTEFFRCISPRFTCQAIQDRSAPLAEQARAVAVQMGTRAPYFEDADFWKLRELSFTIMTPQTFARALRASSASFTIAGRNLATWTDYTGIDPEANWATGSNFSQSEFLTQPPVRYWTTRLNLTF